MRSDNNKIKPGFIFVQESDTTTDTPASYLVSRFGGLGVFHKVDPNHPNGGEPVTYDEYLATEVPLY